MRCCDCEFRNDCEDDVKSNDITCFERCLIRDERISDARYTIAETADSFYGDDEE